MILITRAQARHIRAVLRKSAPVGATRSYRPPLAIHAGEEGLRVRIHSTEVAAEWHTPGPRPPEEIVLPAKALDDFEGTKDIDVALTLQGADLVQARWDDCGVPQVRDYATVTVDKLPPFPVEPKKLTTLDNTFLRALDDAVQTASRENARFALKCLQLRGKAGEIVSTNGRQLLLQRGFAFPWMEEVLIPSISVFGCRELENDGPVAIGKTEKHICIRVGAWKFHLEIDKAARFPRIESVIPSFVGKSTILRIAPDDASFLAHALTRLPGGKEDNSQVTVDLNGHVAIRAREEQSRVTELRLSRSEIVGPAVRFVTNRQFLANAVRLGLMEFHVTSPDAPIVGRDRQRLFVWMPLDKDSAIPLSKGALRINSVNNNQVTPQEPSTQRRISMPVHQTNGHGTNGTSGTNTAGQERGGTIIELITEAEELRTVMLDASARLTRLLSGLKQHRRQSRAVQAAMHSLKQLKLDG